MTSTPRAAALALAREAQEVAERATPGPWIFDTYGASALVLSGVTELQVVAELDSDLPDEDDARKRVRVDATFIAGARALVPQLAAAVLAYEGALAKAERENERLRTRKEDP